jgi:hypothetical protein
LLDEWFGCGPCRLGRQKSAVCSPVSQIPDAGSSKPDARSSKDAVNHPSARSVDRERPSRSGRHIKQRGRAIIQVGARARKTADLRGTLGVTDGVPVGFKEIRLRFDVDADATQDQLDQLIELTDRYCVIFQTIQNSPRTSVAMSKVRHQ